MAAVSQSHGRESSRTRSQLIKDKEESVPREGSVSHSTEKAPSLKHPQPNTAQNMPPRVNNISGGISRERTNSNQTFKRKQSKSKRSANLNINAEYQRLLDSGPSPVKHLRSQSMKSHRHLIYGYGPNGGNGYNDIQEQDSITFQHGASDKDSNGLGTRSHSIREMFAVISQSFIYKYDELYHQFNLVHAKLQRLKTQNEFLNEQNAKLKETRNEYEAQNKKLHLRINKLEEQLEEMTNRQRLLQSADLGIGIDLNELELSLHSDHDNPPQPENTDDYEITPAPVNYDDNNEQDKEQEKEKKMDEEKDIEHIDILAKDTSKDTEKEIVTDKHIMDLDRDDSKEEEKKSDDGTITESDQFKFDRNLTKITMAHPQTPHHPEASDDSMFESQNLNRLLDNIDFNNSM